jgi:putative heme transporter
MAVAFAHNRMDVTEPERPASPRGAWSSVPVLLRAAALYSTCLIVVGLGLYLLVMALARVAPLALAVVASLLLTALVEPVVTLCRLVRAPRWLGALVGVLTVLVVIALPIVLGWRGIQDQFSDLGSTLTTGLDRVRDYLVNGPLSLSPAEVDAVRDDLANVMPHTASDLLTGAATVLEVVAGALVTALLLFFLLRDGPVMWDWFVGRMPHDRRDRIDAAARAGWHILARYTRGIVVVAAVDAVGIGLALVLLDVPLVLPLILLTFIGGFIPYLGATLAGAAAVLVALVSNGLTDALIILAAVLAVQTLEGNLLEPLIVGRAVKLHPAAVLIGVSAGGLLAGIAGAVIAVPLMAVAYRFAEVLNGRADTGVPGPDETASDFSG